MSQGSSWPLATSSSSDIASHGFCLLHDTLYLSIGLTPKFLKCECSEQGCACVAHPCILTHSRCSKKSCQMDDFALGSVCTGVSFILGLESLQRLLQDVPLKDLVQQCFGGDPASRPCGCWIGMLCVCSQGPGPPGPVPPTLSPQEPQGRV